jgi:hypothetical protein
MTDTFPSFLAAASVLSHSAPKAAGWKLKKPIAMKTAILMTVRLIMRPPMQSTLSDKIHPQMV